MIAPRPLRLRWLVAWITLAALGVGIKLFTARYYFQDDPTAGLLFRLTPSLVSDLQLSHFDEPCRIVSDENSFLGEDFHRAVTGLFWWMPTAALALWVARRRLLTPGVVLVALTLGEAVLGLLLAERLIAVERVDLPAMWLLPLPLATAGAALWYLVRRSVPRWLAVAALLCALALAVVLGWGNHTGRIVPYEVWIKQE